MNSVCISTNMRLFLSQKPNRPLTMSALILISFDTSVVKVNECQMSNAVNIEMLLFSMLLFLGATYWYD